MNQDIAQGKWQQLSGKIKQKWGKLTDDDLTRSAGDRDYLVGRLHEQYGLAKDKAESELETLGYGEHDEDRDLRSSSRSSAGRMDMAGQSGSDRKLQAGGSDVDSQHNLDSGSDRRSGVSQESEYDEEAGSDSVRRDAEQGPAGHTLEAGADKQSQRSGSSNPQQGQGGSRNPSDKSSQQQKGGQKAPGSGSNNR
jgi:uncharacterized protein YjbJ (UPF0337 family)